MTFGLLVANDYDYIQIDSQTPRLCAIYSGSYAATTNSNAYISFPAPITTQEPPCIFIQNTPDRPDDLYTGMVISGGAGNWTGFVLSTININFRPYGKWFAAVFSSLSKAHYGLRMWGDDGSIIYDSGTIPVLFSRASHSWSYQGRVTISPISNGYYWKSNLSGQILSDEYFMINPFSRGIITPSHINWTPIGVRFNYGESCLQVFGVTALGAWMDIGSVAAVFARLPGT